MTLPGFGAESALSHAARPYRLDPGSAAIAAQTAVIPQQSLWPPGTPIYSCYPGCTWGPPMVQTCCAWVCRWWAVFPICYRTCFRQMAPLCPR